ncbi:MAG: glycosyltransferase family 9 protein [Ignavibacteriota bacterium]|nr:glycosyltransferase family 9 protein [Ignavibacteriota bacterium]
MSKRILIVRTDRVGDVVMITAIPREIKKVFPDAFVATLTQPNTAKILWNNPYIDEIITDDLSKETFREVVKKIKSLKFDYGLLIHPTERAAYQLFWGRVKQRIGVGRILYEIITFMKSVSRNNYTPLRHEADYCMDLARKIGVKTDNYQPEIFVSEQEKTDIHDYLISKNINKDTFRIVLHTGSKNSAPNWGEDKYYELLNKIVSKYPDKDFAILLTAFEMTQEFKKKVKEINDKRIVDVSDDIDDLRKLIKIISVADLMVCSSTGPIHLADALDRKCIGIHCKRPMNCVKHWGVLNRKSINLEVAKDFCDSNCSSDKKQCGIENGISTEEVLKHIII